MPDPNRIRNVVSAPAYILARPPAARPPRISPTRKTVRNRKGSDGRSSTNAIAFDSGKGPAPKIRNCTARSGPKKGMTAPVARFQANPAATASATRSPMPRWRDKTASAAEASAGIGQDGDEANKYPTQGVRDRIVAGIDDDVHLRTESHAVPRQRLLD